MYDKFGLFYLFINFIFLFINFSYEKHLNTTINFAHGLETALVLCVETQGVPETLGTVLCPF